MALVTVTVEDHVAEVTLNRPEKMNALSLDLIDALIEAGQALAGRDDIRAVVLSGAGRGFCAGLDVANFGALAVQDPAAMLMPRSHGNTNSFQEVALIWRKLSVPVICALHGVCFGGGLQIALGADMRIAGPDARLSVMEMKWGLVPDMGAMALLPQLLASDQIRRLTYLAEEVTADEALRIGLVTELAEDPLARARDIARSIAAKSPSAIRAAKALIGFAETHGNDPDAVLLEESRAQAALIGQPHQMEAVMAGMQKRAPKFD